MPSYRWGKGKPWLARVSIAGHSINLGYYATEDEAKCVEYDHGRVDSKVLLNDCDCETCEVKLDA